ncbi:hypothetical protein NEIMUCOT_04532 [Neisseria mucosa ATCC 25996]|uniref:Uncharacterized protein n=1 Tax=Neisseria mucosa (strain ATCC 25996 / DSM 4631 / NCTC 10774 / M26) TaxID=546266 RepID=D2ZV91_NEIM2|nr:hypothetical protein NEIMUCOT_04532 [Neisseria mucosa ATCC 25996]
MCSAFFRRPFRLKRAIIVKCPPPCHHTARTANAKQPECFHNRAV